MAKAGKDFDNKKITKDQVASIERDAKPFPGRRVAEVVWYITKNRFLLILGFVWVE